MLMQPMPMPTTADSDAAAFDAGEDAVLDTDVHDSQRTMALVDAALKSSRLGGVVPKGTVR